MGVLIKGISNSVLIDGLHKKYKEEYLFPSPELVQHITEDLQPDILLFTHHHKDHYSSNLVKQFLEKNDGSTVFGPEQVTETLKEYEDRTITISTKDYTKQSIHLKDIRITALKVDHAGIKAQTIQNVGYIIYLDNKIILHLGDTGWMEDKNLFSKLKLKEENIDIAILPYWMLLDTKAPEYIANHIDPKIVIANHIPTGISNIELAKLKRKYPKVYFLTEPESKIQLN